MNIAAIVVTHNRPEKLHTCLDSLLSGSVVPNDIYVINNASSVKTKQVIDNFSDRYPAIKPFHLDKNIGGAGGFELGMKSAYRNEADMFWLMDDDCYVERDALEQLLLAYHSLCEKGKNIGFIGSKVNWRDGSVCEMNQPSVDWDYLRVFNSESSILKVIGSSFVSCLVTRHAVDKVGFPIGKFFIWFDDAEYTRRISSELECYCALNSQVIHDTQNNEGVWFGNINEYNIGKFCYGARNESWYRFYKQSFTDWLFFFALRYKEMKSGNVSWRYRLKIFCRILSGLLGNFVK
ncbi:glycosyltransferase [Vibrio nitrifigilis]|uniref:Glycosyltransferase n=1 Tax=Vibrio nitrifigilis TaxID=2789781 RepID=A0ABS0GFL5_9VIBR|nr:glycosyltransferase [Vibrio nitrifigilis]MBF9001207.1 glycosyltransferase [Vibrio nitrifigilis]